MLEAQSWHERCFPDEAGDLLTAATARLQAETQVVAGLLARPHPFAELRAMRTGPSAALARRQLLEPDLAELDALLVRLDSGEALPELRERVVAVGDLAARRTVHLRG